MNYFETFIQIAPDCPVKTAVVPIAKSERKSVAVLEYELLSGKPYFYTQEDLQFATHVRHKPISSSEPQSCRKELWTEFFSKPHACLRASPLPKQYGWGIHFDKEGKIAIYPIESREYLSYTRNMNVKQLFALRNQRA